MLRLKSYSIQIQIQILEIFHSKNFIDSSEWKLVEKYRKYFISFYVVHSALYVG